MDVFAEILKYTLPALVVLAAAYLMIRMFMQNEEKKRKYNLLREKTDTILPLRLQAYERLILFLERISPEALVMRVSRQDLTVSQTLTELVAAIRTEFEHNLVQQTYISTQGWELVKTAKNNMIRMVTETAKDFKPDSNGMLYNRQILENAGSMDKSPVTPAIEFLKREIRELF